MSADSVQREIDEGTDLIRSCPPGNAEKQKAAFNAFRKAVLHATSSRDLPPEAFLDGVMEKDLVLKFLSDFHGEKKMYRKQVEAIFEKVLEVDSWLWVLVQDASLAESLVDELKGAFMKAKDARPLTEPPPGAAPAAPPTASASAPPMPSVRAPGGYSLQGLLDKARLEQEAEEAAAAAASSLPDTAEAPSTVEGSGSSALPAASATAGSSSLHVPEPATSARTASPVPASKGYPTGANSSVRVKFGSDVSVGSFRAANEVQADRNSRRPSEAEEVEETREEQERRALEAAEEERRRQAEAERLAREEQERQAREAAEAEEKKRQAERERLAREEEEALRAKEEALRAAEERKRRQEELQAKIKAEEERKAREFEEWSRAEEARKAREAAELAAIPIPEPAKPEDFWKKSSVWGPTEATPKARELESPPPAPSAPPPPSATAVRRVVAEAWATFEGSPEKDSVGVSSAGDVEPSAEGRARGHTLFPGEKDFARYVSQFQEAVNMMEELNFTAERRDPSSDAFTKFYKAVLKTASSPSTEDDAELEKIEPKSQIIAFLIDVKTRRSGMTSRVAAVLKILDEFESWKSACSAHRDPVITATVRDLVKMPADSSAGRGESPEPGASSEIPRSTAMRHLPTSSSDSVRPAKPPKPQKKWVVWYSIDPRRGQQQFYNQEVTRMLESAKRRKQTYVDISPLMPCKMKIELEPRLSQVTDKGSRDVVREELESEEDPVICYVKKNHHSAWKAARPIGEKAYYFNDEAKHWNECVITGVDSAGDVIVDDEGEEKTIPAMKLGTHFKEARDLTYVIGQKVSYLSPSKGQWFDAVVTRADADGSPGITVRVGEAERCIPLDKMRSHLKAIDNGAAELRQTSVPPKTAIPLGA